MVIPPLHPKRKGIKLALQFLLVGAVAGIILEGYVHWLGKFWYYPYWNYIVYLLVLIPGFALYFLYLVETYFGTKAVIEHYFIHRHKRNKPLGKFKDLFIVLGLVGSLGIGATTVYIVFQNNWGLDLQKFSSIINSPSSTDISIWPLFFLAIFIWFFFEYLEFERHETSMLYEMLNWNFAPVLAVFVAAWASALLYEVFNVPSGYWRYANMPFSYIKLFDVPIVVYLLWPFHYFPLFSLYRVLFKRETEELWR